MRLQMLAILICSCGCLSLIGIPAFAATVHHSAPAGGPVMGPEKMQGRPVFEGYYDGHKDQYLSTDTSSKAESKAMGINYSATLGAIHGSPFIYFVTGRSAAHQLAVFGSEPGESDYSPLWQEVIVTWKSKASPVLLTSDNQINALAKKGTLTARHSTTVLNCPIIKVG